MNIYIDPNEVNLIVHAYYH